MKQKEKDTYCMFVPQDDIIDDVDSFVAAAETLKERGAYKIFVMATHGILSSDAPRFIEESAIDEASLNISIHSTLVSGLRVPLPLFTFHVSLCFCFCCCLFSLLRSW